MSDRTESSPHLSRLALERAAAGERALLPPELAAHLAACLICRDRLAALATDHARWLASIDVTARIDAVLRDGAPRRRRSYGRVGAAAALAACAALAVFALRPRAVDLGPGDERRKGGDRFEVYRRSADGRVAAVADGDSLQPGDAIRFRVTLASPGYVGVLGLDAARAVTAYAPAGPALQWIARGDTTLLDDSIILDATLGPERLVLVVCDTPRPIAELVTAARAALEVAGGDPRRVGRAASDCRESAVIMTKVAP